jgi:hypothetical protein
VINEDQGQGSVQNGKEQEIHIGFPSEVYLSTGVKGIGMHLKA